MHRLITITVAIGCLLAMGCGSASLTQSPAANKARAESQRPARVTPVSAVFPVRDAIRETTVTDNRIEAETRIDVTAEVMGRCTEVNFEEGDTVKKGAVMVRLDDREQQAQLRQQQAQLTNAERESNRAKELFQAGIDSQQNYESAFSSYQQQLETVNQTREQLTKYTIRAPISGIITMEDVQLGQIVSSGTPIFTVVDPNSYILPVPVHEKELPRLAPGLKATVVVDALGDEKLETTVRKIGKAISESSTVDVTLAFKKEDLPKLRDGAYARVELIMDVHENALLIPKEALKDEDGRTFVFAVRELPEEDWPTSSDEPIYKAARVEVLTGLENSDYIEILDGLSEDERVVTDGKDAINSDSFIKVTTADAELQAASEITPEEALEIAAARKERGATSRSMFSPGKSR